MINMGHCRFENTALAIGECFDALTYNGVNQLSQSEAAYAKRLYELAKEYIETYEIETRK